MTGSSATARSSSGSWPSSLRTISMRSRGQSCSRIEEIVRRIMPTGSPQQGTMIPTVGSRPCGSGCGSGTARHQLLATLR